MITYYSVSGFVKEKMATTSFIDEALALYQELQKHIDVASTVASETQTDWGLL